MDGDWLGFSDKAFLVAGVANRRSVGYHVGKRLQEAGAEVAWVVHTEKRREELLERLRQEWEDARDLALRALPPARGRQRAGV